MLPSGTKKPRSGRSPRAPEFSSAITSSSLFLSKQQQSYCRTCRPPTAPKRWPLKSSNKSTAQFAACISGSTARSRQLEHAVLLDREIHWMYNKSRLQPWRKSKGSYLELVVSASQSFAAMSREQAIELSLRELAEFFPAVATAKLEKAALVKEVRATFTVPPGIDAFRPTSASPWPNCVLAGDWIATGWPSTMESAARSGHLAAEAVCAAMNEPHKFLIPDLKPKGLMRFAR